MKKYFLLTLLLFCCQFLFSQVNPATKTVPVTSLRLTPIPSTRATTIRKDTRTLQTQAAQLNDSVTVLKKEMDLLMASMKDKLDSVGEMSETDQLMLQQMMEKMSKLMQTISNIMKKMHDTQMAIVNNLKA